MKTRCLIVDDEPLAIEVVESYLLKLSDVEITAKCSSAIEKYRLDVSRYSNAGADRVGIFKVDQESA